MLNEDQIQQPTALRLRLEKGGGLVWKQMNTLKMSVFVFLLRHNLSLNHNLSLALSVGRLTNTTTVVRKKKGVEL